MPKIVDKSEKRECLIQAAIPIFARQGFHDTKMSDIAIAADVGKGTLYEYFESKDKLFLSAFELWFSTFVEQFHHISTKHEDPYERLVAFFSQYFQTILEYGDIYYVYFDFWSELTRNQSLNKGEINAAYQRLRDLLIKDLEEGVETGIFKNIESFSVSVTLLAIAEGMLIQWLFDQAQFNIHEVGVRSIHRYLDTFR